MVIANIDFLIDAPRPVMPHVIQIPGMFVKEPKSIVNGQLSDFVDSASNGIIASTILLCIQSVSNAWTKNIVNLCDILKKKTHQWRCVCILS